MPKRKERRKKTEEKERGQNCTLPDKKTIEVEINFILFVSTLGTIQAFLYTLLRGL